MVSATYTNLNQTNMHYVVKLQNRATSAIITYIVNAPTLEDVERVFKKHTSYSKRLGLGDFVFVKASTVEESATDFNEIVKETNSMLDKLAVQDGMQRNAQEFLCNFSQLDLDEQRAILTQLAHTHNTQMVGNTSD